MKHQPGVLGVVHHLHPRKSSPAPRFPRHNPWTTRRQTNCWSSCQGHRMSCRGRWLSTNSSCSLPQTPTLQRPSCPTTEAAGPQQRQKVKHDDRGTPQLELRCTTALRTRLGCAPVRPQLRRAGSLAVLSSMRESDSPASLPSGPSSALIIALGMGALAPPAGFRNANFYALFLPLLFALPVLVTVALLVDATVDQEEAAFDLDIGTSGVTVTSMNIFFLAPFHAVLTVALGRNELRAGAVLAGEYGLLGPVYLVCPLLPKIESLSDLSKASSRHWVLSEQPLQSGFDRTGIAPFIAGTIEITVMGPTTVRQRTVRTP